MNTTYQKNKILLISSFHRSGSSMVGKILLNSGLFIGENLMHGERSNPDGHFEDISIVDRHDEILKKHNSSWQFDGSVSLSFNEQDTAYFKNLVTTRNQQHSLWGFKDPRSSLFLDDWSQLLAESGHYLFLYRHYSQCIASLYKRHSQSLCLNKVGNYSSPNVMTDLNFWIDANLAAKMWLAYNRKILEFITKNKDKSLLVSQQAMLSGYPLIEELNKKFNFELNSDSQDIIQHSYTHNEINQAEISGISHELYKEMDDLWEALNAIANAPATTPQIISENKASNLPEKIESLIKAFNPSKNSQIPQTDKIPQSTIPLTTEEQIRQHLQKNECQSALDLLPALIEPQPLKSESWVLAGNVHMRNDDFEKAQQNFTYAITLKPNIPYYYMHLGLAFFAQDKKIETEHFLQLAINKNPKNPSFFFHLGRFYSKYEQFEQAKVSFNQAIELVPDNPQFINNYCQCLIDMDCEEEALLFLKTQCDNNPSIAIIRKYAALLLQQRKTKEATLWYHKHDLLMLQQSDLKDWLENILAQLPENEARNNLQYWVYYHWNKINTKF